MRLRGIAFAFLMLAGCSGAWIEPIAAGSPAPPGAVYPTLGDYLAAVGCRQAVSLTGAGTSLVTTRTPWDPSAPLQGGAGFAASFAARYGIAFTDRRSPLEVETLVELFNRLDEFFARPANVANLGLPVGYQLTFQDKTDLFYVAGPRGGLAIREILEPLLGPRDPPVEPQPPAPPFCPPCPAPPAPCPPEKACPALPEPKECAPVACLPVPCSRVPLQLSARGKATVEGMTTWRTIGPGRRQMLLELAAELAALQKEKPPF